MNHFQQVPLPFWFAIGATIAIAESVRVQKGWQDPGQSDKLFLLKDGYQPGDLEFDPPDSAPASPRKSWTNSPRRNSTTAASR